MGSAAQVSAPPPADAERLHRPCTHGGTVVSFAVEPDEEKEEMFRLMWQRIHDLPPDQRENEGNKIFSLILDHTPPQELARMRERISKMDLAEPFLNIIDGHMALRGMRDAGDFIEPDDGQSG
jgi:hypothetical protein